MVPNEHIGYRVPDVDATSSTSSVGRESIGDWSGSAREVLLMEVFHLPAAERVEVVIAAALHEDPVTFRRRLLVDDDRLRNVLDLAVERSDWGSTASPGDGFGVACHTYHGTAVAMVASVTVSGGVVAVRRIVAALDCGKVVHPDMVVQQIEGGVAFGITALSKRAPTHRDGMIEEQNFDELGLVTMAEMPLVEVHLVPSRERPTGVGEMAVPGGHSGRPQRRVRRQWAASQVPSDRDDLITAAIRRGFGRSGRIGSVTRAGSG